MPYLGVLGVLYMAIIDGNGAPDDAPLNLRRPATNLTSDAYGWTHSRYQRVSVRAGNNATVTAGSVAALRTHLEISCPYGGFIQHTSPPPHCWLRPSV